MVNQSSVLFHEIPSVFVIGSWPLYITITVARSFGEFEIHFLACML